MSDQEKKAAVEGEEKGETTSALGASMVDMKNEMPHLDFLAALVLIGVSVATIITSIGYAIKQRLVFYESAGFMPVIIASVLLVLALRLLVEALKTGTIKDRLNALWGSLQKSVRSRQVRKGIGGICLFAVYIYGLLGRTPFWLASFLALFAILNYAHFDRQPKTVLKMTVIAAVATAVIVGLFQYAFSVPMP